MAVSGRKIADFKDSVSLGSAEDFDHKCDPCLTENQHVEAYGFCVDCQEYLCKSCFKFHQKTKALKNHQLLDKDNLAKAGTSTSVSEVCTEKCSTRRNEVIKFFCPKHEALGCTDCMIMQHRTCDLDYIPDKCAGIEDSAEYRDITEEIDQKMKEIDEVMKAASERDTEIETCHDNIFREISKFRQEINNRLDQLQEKIQKDAAKIMSSGKEIILQVVEISTRVSAEIKAIQSSMQDSKHKSQPGRLYIDIKRAKSKLKSDEIQAAEESLENANMDYKFERNKNLEADILSKEDTFGKLNLSGTPRKMDRRINFTLKEELNVKTKTDDSFFKCCINGCAVLSSGKIVLVDNSRNKKVKIIDKLKRTVIEEKAFDSEPFDVAALPENRFAVTMPDSKEILILSSDDKLSVIRRVPVKGACKGITYHKGQIYVICMEPACLLFLDPQGNMKKTISLNDADFKKPKYIVVSEDCQCIYICDIGNKSVNGVTTQGDILAVYQLDRIPEGMALLNDGSLLIGSLSGQKVLHLSKNFKQCQELLDEIYGAQSICLNRQTGEIFVGGYSCNSLKVFSMK